MTIANVPLDDIDAAVRFYLERKARGGVTEDEMEMLLMAQRDPDALLRRLDEVDPPKR
jgi:hypothetical protein